MSRNKKEGKLYPSKGPFGSVYGMSDGQVYCRTPQGNRKVDPAIGSSLIFAQYGHNRAHQTRRRVLGWFTLLSFGIGLGLGALTL